MIKMLDQNMPSLFGWFLSHRKARSNNKSSDVKQSKLDRLTSLPSGIREDILSYLPTKEAGRTRILSRNWSHQSVCFRRLEFDDKLTKNDIERVIDHVLRSHKGTIDSFKLSTKQPLEQCDLERWILELSRFSIKEFKLDRSDDYIDYLSPFIYSFPPNSYLFSNFKNLTHLELRNCSLSPRWTFQGFPKLENLDLQNVNVEKDVLEKLITASTLLQRMTICHLLSVDVDVLKIDAPNLRFLRVDGDFEEIKLENVPNLVSVSFCLNLNRYVCRVRTNVKGVSKLVHHCLRLPRIERLSIEGCLFEYCAIDYSSICTELPEQYPQLKFLSISMRFNSLNDILVAMYLLRGSSALEVLEIEVRQDVKSTAEEQAAIDWLNNNRLWQFPKLQRLKVTGFSAGNGEVDFFEYLISFFPALQELDISFNDNKSLENGVDALAEVYSSQDCLSNRLRIMKQTTGSFNFADAIHNHPCFYRNLVETC